MVSVCVCVCVFKAHCYLKDSVLTQLTFVIVLIARAHLCIDWYVAYAREICCTRLLVVVVVVVVDDNVKECNRT